MPQLVKGGKHVFGWSRVGATGGVRIPPEAAQEYGLESDLEVILVSASRTSGGFCMMREDHMKESPLGDIFREFPELAAAEGLGKVRRWKSRFYTRVSVRSGYFALPAGEDPLYGVRPGDLLLVVRGSYLGPSFLTKGPLLEEAHQHPELEIFE